MHAGSEGAERRQYLSFVLRGGDYAVPILKVKEILQYEELTAVPGVPRSVRGVLNLRGNVVPVIDLGLKFGLSETSPTPLTCVLVVETAVGEEGTLIGLLADSVSEVMDLTADDVEEPPSFGNGVNVDWLAGMGKLEKRFALLLDIDRVLASDEQGLAVALREAQAAAGSASSSAGAAATEVAVAPP